MPAHASPGTLQQRGRERGVLDRPTTSLDPGIDLGDVLVPDLEPERRTVDERAPRCSLDAPLMACEQCDDLVVTHTV